jgi:hypothetical protein
MTTSGTPDDGAEALLVRLQQLDREYVEDLSQIETMLLNTLAKLQDDERCLQLALDDLTTKRGRPTKRQANANEADVRLQQALLAVDSELDGSSSSSGLGEMATPTLKGTDRRKKHKMTTERDEEDSFAPLDAKPKCVGEWNSNGHPETDDKEKEENTTRHDPVEEEDACAIAHLKNALFADDSSSSDDDSE